MPSEQMGSLEITIGVALRVIHRSTIKIRNDDGGVRHGSAGRTLNGS
jgi:hypothetical protein